MSLFLHTSNRLEILAAQLADLSLAKPLPPLIPETVVVQSRGMARWLSLQVAARCSICAHFDFPFPNSLVGELFRQVLPAAGRAADEPERLIWLIMELLADLADQPAGVSLRGYLENGPELKRYQLARELAGLFDQYVIYRPEMILAWEQGGGQGWQPELWRRLAARLPGPHRAFLQAECLRTLRDAASPAGLRLPPRVSVFGISSLPPYHLQLFNALARHREVHFFVLNPCREFWADILSDREMARVQRRQQAPAEMLHLERGNRLLASMGRLGRDFLGQLCELEWAEEHETAEPPAGSVLAAVQADILELRDRSGPDRQEADPVDRSLQIHSCHSPMREVEVLKDHLLSLFEHDPDLEPRDILVMAPDIERYTPLIQAVFDADPDDPQRIPYSIADRSPRRENMILGGFLALLDLEGSRFEATRVLRLLEEAAVRRRFGLSEADLGPISAWVATAGIRWGMDGAHRGRLGMEPFGEHSWRTGLDRLLLGWAMAARDDNLFGELLPCRPWEGQGAVLGRFLDFMETLFRAVQELAGRKRLGAWAALLLRLIEAFFEPEEEMQKELQQLREAVFELELRGREAPDLKIGLEVVRSHLGTALERAGSAFGFLTGGVTFCAMLPMRAIPARIICLLGLNDADYPRSSSQLGFDLMAGQGRPGDRSRRLDDRYLFLEALLSARQQLYISYVGRSIRDGSSRPPSVLVDELLDYLEQGYFFPDGQGPRRRLVTEHRLQPFAPAYFKPDSGLFSYSREQWQAALALEQERAMPRPLVAAPLPGEPERELDLETLCRFLAQPVRFFCEQRLGLFAVREGLAVEDREPLALAGLDRYRLAAELVEEELAGRPPAGRLEVVRAGCRLPPGNLGEAAYESLCRETHQFSRQVASLAQTASLPPLEVNLELAGRRLTGRLTEIKKQGLLRFRCAAVKPRDQLRLWPLHLLLNVLQPAGFPRESLLVGKDATYRYLAVEQAGDLLIDLLELYRSGWQEPLRFFPRSAAAFAEALLQGKSRSQALGLARRTWQDSAFGGSPGEAADGYHRLCFQEADPLDERFCRLALTVFEPLLRHRRREA